MVLGICSHLCTFIIIFFFLDVEQNLYIERIDSNVSIFAFMVSEMYVVFQFFPWFKLYFPLFWGMVMYEADFLNLSFHEMGKTQKHQSKGAARQSGFTTGFIGGWRRRRLRNFSHRSQIVKGAGIHVQIVI